MYCSFTGSSYGVFPGGAYSSAEKSHMVQTNTLYINVMGVWEEDTGPRQALGGGLALILASMEGFIEEGSYLSDFASSVWLYFDAVSNVSLLQSMCRLLCCT